MGHNVSFLVFVEKIAVQNCRGYCKKIKHRQPLKSKIKHTVMRCSCFMCFSTVGQCVTVNSIIMGIRNTTKKNLLFYKKGLEAATDKTQSVYEGVIKKKTPCCCLRVLSPAITLSLNQLRWKRPCVKAVTVCEKRILLT